MPQERPSDYRKRITDEYAKAVRLGSKKKVAQMERDYMSAEGTDLWYETQETKRMNTAPTVGVDVGGNVFRKRGLRHVKLSKGK